MENIDFKHKKVKVLQKIAYKEAKDRSSSRGRPFLLDILGNDILF